MQKKWFTVKQVHSYVYAIAEFSHWEKVVSYLLIGKNKAYLIDTGMGYEDIKKEVIKITNLPITVLLTHAHWDHIGSINSFNDIYIYDHKFEIESLSNGFYSKSIKELTNNKFFENRYKAKDYLVKGITSFKTFTTGEKYIDDNFSVEIIHTPGHTPGSVCFLVKELGLLFTGDTLYPGPLYAQLEESNLIDFYDSILLLEKFKDEVKLILPGHNMVSSDNRLISQGVSATKTIKKKKDNPIHFLL